MGKKRIVVTSIVGIITVLFILSSISSAEIIGNPANYMAPGSFQVAAECGLWERDMKFDLVTGLVEGNRIFGKIMYGLNEKLCIFGKVGMTSLEFETPKVEIETDMEIAYGVGAKFNFYEEDQVKVGVIFQFTKLSGEDTEDVSGFNVDGYGSYSGEIKGEFDATEIDFGVGASYDVNDTIHCYGGLYYSKMSVDLEATVSGVGKLKTDADEDDPIGIFLGGEYNVGESAIIGVEARVMAESSFSVFCSFTF